MQINERSLEIIRDFQIFTSQDTSPIRCGHLAEGPGGFIEALVHLRKNKQDKYYGITLITDKVGIPGWNKSNQFLKKALFTLTFSAS